MSYHDENSFDLVYLLKLFWGPILGILLLEEMESMGEGHGQICDLGRLI